jgi:hypothetical protein
MVLDYVALHGTRDTDFKKRALCTIRKEALAGHF